MSEMPVVFHQTGDKLDRLRLVDGLLDATGVHLVAPALLGAMLTRECHLRAVLERLGGGGEGQS